MLPQKVENHSKTIDSSISYVAYRGQDYKFEICLISYKYGTTDPMNEVKRYSILCWFQSNRLIFNEILEDNQIII